MKITQLRRLDADSSTANVRTTAAQDMQITENSASRSRRIRWLIVAGGAQELASVLAWLAHAWSSTSHKESANVLSISTVKRGHFVRDVAAEGGGGAAGGPARGAGAPGASGGAGHA